MRSDLDDSKIADLYLQGLSCRQIGQVLNCHNATVFSRLKKIGISLRHPTKDIRERFWSYVDKKSNSECWEWAGPIQKDGYGYSSVNHKRFQAHRTSWELHFGEIPNGLCVCHHCDNPCCVNPNHLFLGTTADNIRDMFQKGRHRCGSHFGSKNSRAKLTEEQVLEIRQKYVPHKYSQRKLAKEYKVSRTAIKFIIARRTWKHI